MKILQSISKIYLERKPFYLKLKTEVDNIISANKKETWHYHSRIKTEESFALKIETGRVKNPLQLEDFFAGTLVVENINEIQNALTFIDSIFMIRDRRPASEDFTHKKSCSFEFDDLRLFLTLKKVDYMPTGSLDNLLFEIQIKTFLQHAWSIATHDLIYKSDDVSWSKERVAFQVKAMLEQAELTISGADALSKLPELAKNNHESNTLNEAKLFLTSVFSKEKLPHDLLRLSNIVGDLLKCFDLTLTDLKVIIDFETNLHRGVETLNLSPYGIIIQSIVNQKPAIIEKAFKVGNRLKSKGIFLPSELLLSDIIIEDDTKIVRL